MNFSEKRQIVLKTFPQVCGMSGYDMVCLLQKQFNHKENDLNLDQEVQVKNAFDLLISENEETRDAIQDHDFKELRDGIGDQLTVAHFLAFKINGLNEATLLVRPNKPTNYQQHYDFCTSKLTKFQNALLIEKNIELAQEALNEYVSELYNVPESAQFNVDDDLLEITISSLGKICESLELAEKTLKAYQEKGYIVHIEQSEHGYIILVTEDCVVKGKNIPKGKFLKSLEFIEVEFESVEETPIWN